MLLTQSSLDKTLAYRYIVKQYDMSDTLHAPFSCFVPGMLLFLVYSTCGFKNVTKRSTKIPNAFDLDLLRDQSGF